MENRNSSISVNVFGYEKLVYTLRISDHNYKCESNVNLLLISDDRKQHYGWIKDIGKLLSLQTSKVGHVRHVCFRCLKTFNSKESLASHYEYCKSYEIQIELPEGESKISFKNHNRSMRVSFIVSFIVYADFESFTPQLSTCQPNPEKSYINQYQKHIPADFVTTNCFDDTLYSQQPVTFLKEFTDDDVAQIFIDEHETNIKEIYKKFKFPKSISEKFMISLNFPKRW